jgi:glycosyltransferase involved in cell wall biosynthesis
MLVSIVIPTLNEAKGIVETIAKIPLEELRRRGFDCEVIVVNGGSTDGTVEVAKSLGVKVVIEPRRGYGRAYKTGFTHAKGDIIVALDGDASYPSELIPKLIELLVDKELDFITTDRFASAPSSMKLLNRIGNLILSSTTRLLFKINLRDSQSGMWVFRRHLLRRVMPGSEGMPFSEEIKINAFHRTKRAAEVPIPYRERVGARKLRMFRDGLMNLLYLLKLFVRTRRQ